MASQDETPTDRSTTPGEPPNGAADSAPAGQDTRIGSRSGAHSAQGAPALHGPDEHADWDAEFNSIAGTADPAAERDAPGATAAPEPAEDSAGQPQEQAHEEPGESGESGDSGSRADETVQRSGTVQPAATVPGGHPSLPQRSELPMRRASTLPDLTGYTHEDREDGTAGTHGSTAAVSGTAASGTAAPEAPASDEAGPAAGAEERRDSAAGGTGGSQAGSSQVADSVEPADPESAADPEPADPEPAEPNGGKADQDSNGAAVLPEEEVSPEEAERRAKEREKAAAGKPVLARVLQVMIAVFFPVMVLAAAIRAVATPLFLWAEYHRPGFPEDAYGFSPEDRMTYGSYAVDYLSNFSGPRYLGDLVRDGGEPLYLASEVSHMADVKTVLTAAFTAAAVMLLLSLAAALYLRRRSPGGIRRSLFAGAVVTLALVAVLVVLALLGWEQFFTQLHTIFFANGNWTFRLDDTLIRLFPAQFWMDAGIAIAALVLLTCAAVLACCWPTKARRERVRQAREEARRRYAESMNAL